MKHSAIFACIASSVALFAATPAYAVPIVPVSYDTPNGDGQAHGGTYNYWDANYSGAGSKTTDGAALSGGLGKLTDGVVSTSRWDFVSNSLGTGQYVGWLSNGALNPLLTFTFAGSPTISSVAIQLDNSQYGGVFAPASILIDGVATPFIAPSAGTVGTVNFTGLNLTGSTHTIQFFQQPNTWTFVSEISFDGIASAAPEPATWLMMIMGFGLVGASLRQRRARQRVRFA